MLDVQHLRDLLVDPEAHPRGQPHLSAASGLVRAHGWLYVVADDEHHLGVLTESADSRQHGDPVALHRLFDGDLPNRKGKRKDAKPDLETLTALPPMPGCPFGALLALGSGSRPTRERGVLLALDAEGALTGRMAHISLSALYQPLRKRFKDLNIEGAFFTSGELRLLQRGNKGDARNACVSYDWNLLARWLADQSLSAPPAKATFQIELGEVDGVPLGLTDGAALSDGAWVFSAVAENTDNSFADGGVPGSAIGVVAPDGTLRQLHRLSGAPKVEGIAVQRQGDDLTLTLVTDADDPDIASQLLQTVIALE